MVQRREHLRFALEPGEPLGAGFEPDVSPDNRWVAYTSTPTQAEQSNVVVQPLSGSGSRTTASAGGGVNPVWSGDGRTLYYLRRVLDPDGTTVFAVDVTAAGGVITAGTPRELFRNPESQTCNDRCYDVSDGPRFLLTERTASVKRASVTRMDLVLNWTSTLPKGR